MWNKKETEATEKADRKEGSTRRKLPQEILELSAAAMAIAIFFFGFLSTTSHALVLNYCDTNDILFTETLEWTINTWIQSLSFVASVFLFVVLFLFLVGQKIAYLKDIILGIEALRMHRMDYEIPLEGNNEFTQLAESINYLSKTERQLQQKETQMREEKETLIRALSHDIRTPLTAILSYSEYLKEKDEISKQEMDNYITLMQQKAQQMKVLTNQLLDGGSRTLEKIKNGGFLMEQLADEWESSLEDTFMCDIHLEECPAFSGEFDIQELRRIFDNLASNIEKYADVAHPIILRIFEKEQHLVIEQKNKRKTNVENVESNKIGIESIRKIAQLYGGNAEVMLTEQDFCITIMLIEIMEL
uniref:histidine kinase dimerization/phospho-acceptor domain-containing protein n=1 Tax=Agathobacter sp. TaxID=2021311 RepID=UPI0040577A06